MKIISPKYDYCAKELFRNEVVRNHFLSDILEIPMEEIRSSRLLNTFLWKRYRSQKQGILDVLIELNNNIKINIEIQVKASADWDKRQLFYLAKIFTAEANKGDDYSRLRRCVAISILDFNLSDGPEYHTVYLFRDKNGIPYSDMMEIHTLELRKNLVGQNRMNDWIRLFNAESEEDLDMIKTENAGILEAIREVKVMSLSKRLRAHYEAHMKDVRDRKAREKYVRMEGEKEGFEKGLQKGINEGIEKGMEKGIEIFISDNLEEGKNRQQIIEKLVSRFGLSEKDAIMLVDKYTDRQQ